MTKYAGLEGTSIFASDKIEKLKNVSENTLKEARELSNFAFTLKGASMNSHLGFKYNFNPRGTDTDGNPAITLKLYTKPEQMNPAADRPVYEFAAPYMV